MKEIDINLSNIQINVPGAKVIKRDKRIVKVKILLNGDAEVTELRYQ